jgi:hypothetical protein
MFDQHSRKRKGNIGSAKKKKLLLAWIIFLMNFIIDSIAALYKLVNIYSEESKKDKLLRRLI